jgi:heme/copper-type cytochrome/quinol oxidase subunit 1
VFALYPCVCRLTQPTQCIAVCYAPKSILCAHYWTIWHYVTHRKLLCMYVYRSCNNGSIKNMCKMAAGPFARGTCTIKAQFAVIFIAVNITLSPQHFLGLAGIHRRYSDYPDGYTTWNIVSSVGSTISFVRVLTFISIIWERITTNRQILFPTQTRNSIEWIQNLPPAEHSYQYICRNLRTQQMSVLVLLCTSYTTCFVPYWWPSSGGFVTQKIRM